MDNRIMELIKKSECGMALPMALIMLVLAALIVVPSLYAVQSLMTINSKVSQNTLAYYAAEAGVADLIWSYQPVTGRTPRASGHLLTNINGMNVKLTLRSVENITGGHNYFWESSATNPNSSAKILVKIKKMEGTTGNNVFEQAVAALDGDIDIDGEASIISDNTSSGNYGNVYANGDVRVDSAHVGGKTCPAKGTASASGSVNLSHGGCVGSEKENAAPVSYTVTISDFTSSADAGTRWNTEAATWKSGGGTHTIGPGYVVGDVTIAGSNIVVLQGNLHVKGALKISSGGQIRGAYTVICDGPLTINGGATANLAAGNIPFFITTSNATGGKDHSAVNIGGSSEITAVIYAPNGDAYLSGGVGDDGYNVYGSVIAKRVFVHSMVIKYLSGIYTESQIPGTGQGGDDSATLVGYDYQ